jgi:hypothetical protein
VKAAFAGPRPRPYGRGPATPENAMNEDVLNTSVRKFLKQVGVTSQREIEKAVRDAIESGKLKGNEKLPAKMVLTIDKLGLRHEVSEDIELG